MLALKLKMIIATLLIVFGYFIISVFLGFLGPLYGDPMSLLDLWNLIWLFVLILILSVWVYATSRFAYYLYLNARLGHDKDRVMEKLDKELEKMEMLLDTAKKEYLKRRINRKTFEDIQSKAGNKIVEIKARKKELEQGNRE